MRGGPILLSASIALVLAAAGCSALPASSGNRVTMQPTLNHPSRTTAAPATTVRRPGGPGDMGHSGYPDYASMPAASLATLTDTRPDFGAEPTRNSRALSDRHSSLVGLYGDLVERPALGGGRFDGAGNLAQITNTSEGACFDPDTTPDGAYVVFASTQHRRAADIYLKSAQGRTMTQLTNDPADDVMPSFAPDGNRIAFASNRAGDWNLYVISRDGGPAMQLTDSTEHELHPSWSPDGSKIVYCRLGAQLGRWELWVLDLSTRVHHFLDYGLFPQWNPDPARSKIVFQRARERGSRLFSVWTLDYQNGEALHPTEIVSAANAAAMHPTWSPDGRRIAFVTVLDPDRVTGDALSSDVWVIDDNGTNRTNLTNGGSRNLYPEWSADGTVYFLSDRSGHDNIWAVATGRTIDLSGAQDRSIVSQDPDMERPQSP